MTAGHGGPNMLLSIAIVIAFIVFIYLKVSKRKFSDVVNDIKDLLGGTKNAK